MPDGRAKVLVVDDDEVWVDTISDFLSEEGYSVVGALNGFAALETLSKMQPVAVVTDIQMPMMDGWQLLARVHAQDAGMPVIVVTAQKVVGRDAIRAGAFRVIRKPVPVEVLLAALEAAKGRLS
jgi:CheY-like chemotaxis protein